MHPNFCSRGMENPFDPYEDLDIIESISEIKPGDYIQMAYWASKPKQYGNKYCKVLAVGKFKIFVENNDENKTECAYSFKIRQWVKYIPRKILCLDTKNNKTVFLDETENYVGIIKLKTEDGQYILAKED